MVTPDFPKHPLTDDKFLPVLRGSTAYGFIFINEDLVLRSLYDWKPTQGVLDWCCMLTFAVTGH